MTMANEKNIEKAYLLAKEEYAKAGVDTEQVLEKFGKISISLHCWQGDDVRGFENPEKELSGGGIQATGNYPGRARNFSEMCSDLDEVWKLLPGKHRLNLHSIYAETNGTKVERNNLEPGHFAAWIDYAKAKELGLDFNGSFFSHPQAASGFTLASLDSGVRQFWIEHGIACRKIGATMGEALGTPCVTNVWIPDGYKNTPVNRKIHRELLQDSLDKIFALELPENCNLDAVESKLFGIGSESYVVGSHEFYLGYALQNEKLVCLDMGHFHPRESIADKISATLLFAKGLLLHVSRGLHWDSDHVVILNDEVMAVAQELVRGNYLSQVKIGLDYFDASINRVAAWATGCRALLKALLIASLEPVDKLLQAEVEGDYTSRLTLLEANKTLPWGVVWNYYCQSLGVPQEREVITVIKNYENAVLSKR